MFDWPVKAWIVSTPRSGSTWLCSLLNLAVGIGDDFDDPEPGMFGEHFHPRCSHRFPEYEPVVSKVHIHWLDDPIFVRRLPPPETRIIQLIREDKVAQVWSMVCSSRLGLYNTKEPERRSAYRREMKSVTASQSEFSDHLKAIERWERLSNFLFANHPHRMLVTYEQLERDPESVVRRCFEFLTVPDTQWNYLPARCLRMRPEDDRS
jgi:LPS sulfotransferase NodH